MRRRGDSFAPSPLRVLRTSSDSSKRESVNASHPADDSPQSSQNSLVRGGISSLSHWPSAREGMGRARSALGPVPGRQIPRLDLMPPPSPFNDLENDNTHGGKQEQLD